MKAMLCILLLVSCSSTVPYSGTIERHGIIMREDGNLASFVYIGEGYALTARHVIYKDSTRMNFLLFYREQEDDMADIIAESGDVVLLRTKLDIPFDMVGFAEADVGEELSWAQQRTHTDIRGTMISHYLMKGSVSRIDQDGIFIDSPIWVGASGAGIYNKDGQLVAIVHGYRPMHMCLIHSVVFGIGHAIPDELLSKLRPE